MRGDRRNTDGRRPGEGRGGEERRFTFTFFLFRSDAAKKKEKEILPPLLCNPYMRLRLSPPPTPFFRTVCSSLTPPLPHIKEILTPGLKLHKRGMKRRRGSNWPNCSDVAAGIIYAGAELSRCPRRVITSAASKILISAELMLCLVAQTAAAAAADVVFPVSSDCPSWSATRHRRRRHPGFAQMRCAVTMSTSGEEIWKKPWREISFLFRVCRVCARLGFSRAARGGSKQSCSGPLRKDRRRAGGGGGWESNLLEKGAPLGAGEV